MLTYNEGQLRKISEQTLAKAVINIGASRFSPSLALSRVRELTDLTLLPDSQRG